MVEADIKMLDEEIRIRQQAEHGILQRVSELNQKYEANDFNGISDTELNYKIIIGQVPILLSAPHTVRQLRDGEMKERDGMTGGLAEYLCEQFGLWGVIRTWNAADDPNYGRDARSENYRCEVARLVREQGIKWMIDLHGCRNKYGFDLDIGVNDGRNLACTLGEVRELAECWRKSGLDVRVDEQFQAHGDQAVSNYVHRATGANCLQIEASSTIRTTGEGLEKFCVGLAQVLEKLKNSLAQK